MNEPPRVVRRHCPMCRTPFYSALVASYEPARCQFCFAMVPGNPTPAPGVQIRNYLKESQPMPNPNKCLKCDAPCELPLWYCESCLMEHVVDKAAPDPNHDRDPNTVHNTVYDPVNHPKHYTSHPSGVECIQITEHMSFNLGNAVKYLWRADEKGTPITDLEKAVWYISREIAKRQRAVDSLRQGNLEV